MRISHKQSPGIAIFKFKRNTQILGCSSPARHTSLLINIVNDWNVLPVLYVWLAEYHQIKMAFDMRAKNCRTYLY